MVSKLTDVGVSALTLQAAKRRDNCQGMPWHKGAKEHGRGESSGANTAKTIKTKDSAIPHHSGGISLCYTTY